jgi:transcriptional regulator with GAF, ATPase, and Fis domain
VNCAAVTETLLEAELFGHEKGAFTGAVQSRRGVFERADRGTLFLDEIGEMSAGMQAKLLRVLQEGDFERVGGHNRIAVDVRVICATNRDLKLMVDDGAFREDLFYRINVAHIHVPPLRERPDDIGWFAHMFVKNFSKTSEKSWTLTAAGEEFLCKQSWPGNVRELKHAMERACIFSSQTLLGPSELGASLPDKPPATTTDACESLRLKGYLEHCERTHIVETLKAHAWQISATAQALGISRKNLWEKMRKYKIRDQETTA